MSDGNKSLPIIRLAYRLTLEINQAVVKLPRHQRPGVGIPLGSAVSSLPSNLYLDPFDHRLKDELGYARFADSYNFCRRQFADFRLSRNREKR